MGKDVHAVSREIARDDHHVVVGLPHKGDAALGIVGFVIEARYAARFRLLREIPDRLLCPVAQDALELPRRNACMLKQVTLQVLLGPPSAGDRLGDDR